MPSGIEIVQCECTQCGNRWVHSHKLIKIDSGYSHHADPDGEPCCLFQYSQAHPYCFRCINPELPHEWPGGEYKPQSYIRKPKSKPTPKRELTDEEVLNLLGD